MNKSFNATLQWEVNEEGFIFSAKKRPNGSNAPLEWLLEYSDLFSPFDAATISILKLLLDEELADECDSGILITHDTIADLPDEERNGLGLTEPFPFDIEIRAWGGLGSEDFKYDYRYLKSHSDYFANPTRLGAYLIITSEQNYLLLGDQYRLVEAMDAFNSRPTDERSLEDNFLKFSTIKNLAQATVATLDKHLYGQQVVAPEKIGIRLRRIDHDTIEVVPLLEGVPEEGFLTAFDRKEDVSSFYSVRDADGFPVRVVTTEPKKKDALKQIKRYRRVSGQEKETLLENPQAFFDPDVVDLDDFSERVKAVDEYRPKVFPFLRPEKEAWLPPEGGLVIDGSFMYIPPDEAPRLRKLVEEAIRAGQKIVEWKNQRVPAIPETLQALKTLVDIIPSKETTRKEAEERCKLHPTVLIIRDNIEELEYFPGRVEKPPSLGPPKSLKSGVKMLAHQVDGLKWLQECWANNYKGALLADDMGLGKTLQALAFLAWYRELAEQGLCGDAKPVLIVAPAALLENWLQEYDQFLNPIFGPILRLHGSGLREFKRDHSIQSLGARSEMRVSRETILAGLGFLLDYEEIAKAEAVITTYETLRDYQFSLGRIEWGVIVLDEAQKIKSPGALVTHAVKAMKYDFGIVCTGTPVENSWVDLWSLMDFVQPGHLGSLKEFASEYQNPLRKAETDRGLLGHNLRETIKPLLMRRLKEDHLAELPKIEVYIEEQSMPEAQLARYIDVVNRARKGLPDRLEKGRKQHIFTTIATLRDISLHPELPWLDQSGFSSLPVDTIVSKSARLLKTMEIIEKVQELGEGEKVICFLISRKMQRALRRILQDRFGITAHIINGEVAGGRRKSLIDAFQETPGFNIIILSPEAAGVGLNITAANHVIHLGRPWNPAKEDQATCRVYRIGQERPVSVYLPLAVTHSFETFDVKLHKLLEYKKQLSRSVLLPTVISDDERDNFGEEIFGTEHCEAHSPSLDIIELDRISPEMFEQAIAALYRAMGYQAILTPHRKDFGADVVALAHCEDGPSYLIQCKHSVDPTKAQRPNGIQEIVTAEPVYREQHSTSFEKVVITNANSFTAQAQQMAKLNQVALVGRKQLQDLLKQYPITAGEVWRG